MLWYLAGARPDQPDKEGQTQTDNHAPEDKLAGIMLINRVTIRILLLNKVRLDRPQDEQNNNGHNDENNKEGPEATSPARITTVVTGVTTLLLLGNRVHARIINFRARVSSGRNITSGFHAHRADTRGSGVAGINAAQSLLITHISKNYTT